MGNEFDGTRCNHCDEKCQVDWADKSANDGYESRAPVGTYPEGASWCGALDLAGNVWEWASDWYRGYPSEPQVNPAGPDLSEQRVLRGASWLNLPWTLHSFIRDSNHPLGRSNIIGFRCARDD